MSIPFIVLELRASQRHDFAGNFGALKRAIEQKWPFDTLKKQCSPFVWIASARCPQRPSLVRALHSGHSSHWKPQLANLAWLTYNKIKRCKLSFADWMRSKNCSPAIETSIMQALDQLDCACIVSNHESNWILYIVIKAVLENAACEAWTCKVKGVSPRRTEWFWRS